MKIAVEGCCHGELDKIYETIEYLEQKNNIKVDLLLNKKKIYIKTLFNV
jgi:lariat debranching enzyme